MSNVSRVSPYRHAATRGSVDATAAGMVVALGVAAVVARWLLEESASERQARERARANSRQDRAAGLKRASKLEVQAGGSLPVNTAALNLRDADALVKTAEGLGYRSARRSATGPIRLVGRTGEKLAIDRATDGRLVVHNAGPSTHVQTLVREHTLQRAVEHLGRQGMSVQTARLANGELQIFAKEAAAQPDGAAEVRAQIHGDGSATLDVDGLKGGRCEQVVKEFADATGCEVLGTEWKDAAFQLPGEPAKSRVRI